MLNLTTGARHWAESVSEPLLAEVLADSGFVVTVELSFQTRQFGAPPLACCLSFCLSRMLGAWHVPLAKETSHAIGPGAHGTTNRVASDVAMRHFA